MIRKILNILLPFSILNYLIKIRQKNDYKKWEKNGRPIPPPHYMKQLIIQQYQKEFGYETLIETGTFLGDMIEAQKNIFRQIISIELSYELYLKAKNRFKKCDKIKIIYGDSSNILVEVLEKTHQPVIFWLDGHYSEGITAKGDKKCPVLEEMKAIFKNNDLEHVILIDDARFFNGEGDFPSINELRKFINLENPGYQVIIENDIIRCLKRINR